MKRKTPKYDPEQRAQQPSRIARRTGYRTDAARHRAARFKLTRARRLAIARAGGAGMAAAAKKRRSR